MSRSSLTEQGDTANNYVITDMLLQIGIMTLFFYIFSPTSEGRKEPREGPRPVLPRFQSASSSCLCKQPRWRWRSSRGCRWTRWWWWRTWRQRRAWVSSYKHSLHCNIRNNTQILTMVPPCQREQLKRRRESKIRPTCLISDWFLTNDDQCHMSSQYFLSQLSSSRVDLFSLFG